MHSISNSFQTDCHNSICHVEEGAIIGESLRSIFVDAVPPVPPKGFISTKTKPKHVECSLIPCLKTFFDLNLGGSPSFLLIIKGLTFTVIAGAALGSLMPKNKDLSYTYSYISSIIGYTFCTASIIMLFPQIITNYRSKKVDGLSTDSMIFGFIKSGSYAIYTSCFLWNSTIRQEYKIRNGSDAEITVMSNDVAYTLFTLLLKVIILCQMMCYRGFVMSRLCMFLVAMMTIAIIVYILCIHTRVSPLFNWYDLLYLFATYNTILTFMQYIPQVEMNLERKSTKGLNIWRVLLDFEVGVLILVQMILDCIDLEDFSSLSGNWSKLLTGLTTSFFCAIMLYQHYVLYREAQDVHDECCSDDASSSKTEYEEELMMGQNNPA